MSDSSQVYGTSDHSPILAYLQQAVCENLARMIIDPDRYQAEVRSMDLPVLAQHYDNFSKLTDLLEEAGSAVEYVLPTISELRSMCLAEGIRRGYILSPGEKGQANVVAQLVAQRLMNAQGLCGPA